MIAQQREAALRLADRLRSFAPVDFDNDFVEAATLLRELAQEPQAEPVAWMGVHDRTDLYYRKPSPSQVDVIPLYAHPPQRKPLTEDEIWNNDGIMAENTMMLWDLVRLVRAIEAAHGITEALLRLGGDFPFSGDGGGGLTQCDMHDDESY